MNHPTAAEVIRQVVGRTCLRPVRDRERLGEDLRLDAAAAIELQVALELALRCEFQDFPPTDELTVGDLVRILAARLGGSRR